MRKLIVMLLLISATTCLCSATNKPAFWYEGGFQSDGVSTSYSFDVTKTPVLLVSFWQVSAGPIPAMLAQPFGFGTHVPTGVFVGPVQSNFCSAQGSYSASITGYVVTINFSVIPTAGQQCTFIYGLTF